MSSERAAHPDHAQTVVETDSGTSFWVRIFVYSHFSEAGLHFNKGVNWCVLETLIPGYMVSLRIAICHAFLPEGHLKLPRVGILRP